MQRVLPWIGLCALIIAVSASCDNPADDVPTATVTEAQPVSGPAVAPESAPAVTPDPEPAAEEPATEPEPVTPESAPEPEPAAEPMNLSFTDNSMITFKGSKVTGTHSGGFVDFTGAIAMADGTFDTAQITIDIDMTSLFSDNSVLTDTLKGERFFEVGKFATSTFVSTTVEKTGEGYTITGNLEMHGVTKGIAFPVTVSVNDGVLTSTAEFSIDRFQWDIKDEGMQDDLIRKEVVIRFDIEAA